MPDDIVTTVTPRIERVQYEIRRRELAIAEVSRLTPHMIRVILQGDELADFASAAADDHIKVFVPGAQGTPETRDYTPRAFDNARRELVIDFVDHGDGPAASWARAARVGDMLKIAGPRGSRVIAGDIRNWVFVGDETALPAIGRFLEELPAGTRATAIVAVPGPADEQLAAPPHGRGRRSRAPACGAARAAACARNLRLDRRRGECRAQPAQRIAGARPSPGLAEGGGILGRGSDRCLGQGNRRLRNRRLKYP
ncbi:MAG TPA: siderophore-interacting protein [Paracoccus sp. (in: a-proteobacteria)]|nr:siderophore-interacting protein [Paracoccus sp. (in: a-proteobacteria)]